MRFQITTEEGKTKEYDSFKEAAKDLELETRTLYRFLRNNVGGGKFTRRKDQKVVWIEEVGESKLSPMIKIDGETFFSIPKVLRKFGLNHTKFLNQLKKNHFGFLDSEGNPHRIDWMAEVLSDVIDYLKSKKIDNAAKLQAKCIQQLGGRQAKAGKTRANV